MIDRDLNSGDEVLIFTDYKDAEKYEDFEEEPFIRGKIIEKELSDDLSYHGSSWNRNIYHVMDNDGNIYRGFYGFGTPRFLTVEDYIKHLYCLVDNESKKIQDKIERIKRIKVLIESLSQKEEKKVLKK